MSAVPADEIEFPSIDSVAETLIAEHGEAVSGAEREPALRRFVDEFVKQCGATLEDTPEVLDNLDYFQRNVISGDQLPVARLRMIAVEGLARADGWEIVKSGDGAIANSRAIREAIAYAQRAPISDDYDEGLATLVARHIKDHGLPPPTVTAIFRQHYNARRGVPFTDKDVERIVKSACVGDGGMRPPWSPPMIKLEPRSLLENVRDTEAAILGNYDAPPIFNYGKSYARVVGGKFDHLNFQTMRQAAMESAAFMSRKGKEWVGDKVSDDVVNSILSRRGGKAAEISGLLHAPTICPDGRIIERAGLDYETGLYAAFEDGKFPRAAAPDVGRFEIERLAKKAYDQLCNKLFADFPFASRLDLASAVAAVVTGVVRRMCGDAPIFLLSAAMRGSGKSSLATLITAAVEGSTEGALPWASKEEELEKLVVSALRTGSTVLSFDNIKVGTRIDSPTLARLTTTERFRGRLLGKSEMVDANGRVLILLNGNNVVLEGDMPSRTIEIRLDPKTDRPDQRSFSRDDLTEWCARNRPWIVMACVAIVRHGLQAERASAKPSRFAKWDRMVRFPVMAAGGEDVAKKFDQAHKADPTRAALGEMLALWSTAIGTEPVSTAQLIAAMDRAEFSEASDGFRSATCSALNWRPGTAFQPQALGMKLHSISGIGVAGMRLTSSENRNGVKVWGVEVI